MRKILTASALALACSSANAAMITFQDNYPPPISESLTEIDVTLTLGQFDTSLGTLTSIVLTLFGSATSSATFTNSSPGAQNYRAEGTVDLFFDDLGGILSPLPSISLVLPYTGGGFVSIEGNGGTFSSGTLTDSDSVVYNILTGNFGFFSAAGGGTFDLGCESLSGLNASGGGGNVNADQRTEAGCGAQVVYTYDVPTPAPAPATLALLGLGLAGLAGLRRRQR